MDEVTVQIIKAALPCWYAGLEGEFFKVYTDKRDYILKEDYDRGHRAIWRHIFKGDAKVVGKPSEKPSKN